MKSIEQKSAAELAIEGAARAGAGAGLRVAVGTHYHIECRDKHGNLKWTDEFDNLVVTAGLNDLLDKRFKASAYTSGDFVGITAGTPTFAAADTMASHAGWTEVAAYSEATRPALTLGAVAAGSVSNTASKARFTVNANATVIGGAFVNTTSNKSGTTGILYGGGAFSAGNKTLDSGDTLDVTITLTITAT